MFEDATTILALLYRSFLDAGGYIDRPTNPTIEANVGELTAQMNGKLTEAQVEEALVELAELSCVERRDAGSYLLTPIGARHGVWAVAVTSLDR